MKIVFIDPPGDVSGFNTGLSYLAAVLKRKNHDVSVVDFNNRMKDQDDRLDEIKSIKPDIIGISVKTSTIKAAGDIAESLKGDSVRIVAGGPGVTCARERFLEENPVYSDCFIGETERSFVSYIENNNADMSIPGLCRRKQESVVCSESELIEDLDSLPNPDYSVFDTIDLLSNQYPLVTSRGCPYDCTYCSVNKVSGRKWRKRDPQNVIDELIEAKKKYSIKRFNIADDNFTMDVNRAKKICRLLIEKKLDLSWGCINGIRADRVDNELLQLMHKAGCDVIWFGVESLDKNVFDLINKGENLDVMLNAIKMAKEAGLSVGGFFIAGLPGSTYQKDTETLKKAQTLGFDEMLWSLCTPYPYTGLWDWAHKNARFISDYQHTSFFKSPKPVIETDDYSASERLRMFYEGNLGGYSYSCFFPKKISFSDIIRFIFYLIRYNPLRIHLHLKKILFGRYHRKYIKEFIKRFF
ncbi:MAG: radical SAM protein [Endomicrobiales bacterium]|nr:radical SAM protein [Endomicrobiales bacterium]